MMFSKLSIVTLAATQLLVGVHAQQTPSTSKVEAASPKKIQVLIITGRDSHDWRGVTPVMRKELDDAGIFETRVAEEFRDAGPEAFRGYDVAVLVYSDNSKATESSWTDRTRAALLDFVQSGKGVVIYHHSTTSFENWPEFAKLCGGNYVGKAQHSEIHDYIVSFTDHDHPITRGLASSFLQPHDELYANLTMQPAGAYHVLATAWDDPKFYHGKWRVPVPDSGNTEPMMWTVQAGQGRVFSTMIGHSADAVQSAGFRTTFTRGVEWAATGNVTQPVPADMADKK